jgi:uroporphyrinogen decarboxylase
MSEQVGTRGVAQSEAPVRTDQPVPRLLQACRRLPVDATPVWLMRQAGRYLPAYRRLRESHGFMRLMKTPELACEVTLQPVHDFGMDAAIIFADILTPLEGMGLDLEFVEGKGPVLHNPVRNAQDVERLTPRPPEEMQGFTLDALRLVRAELAPLGIPLIGFAGAPFTLAAYAVEGGGSRNHLRVKGLMLSDRPAWHGLMSKLADVVGASLLAQAEAGAQVLQIFDSWVGQVAPDDYRDLVLPYTRRAIEMARAANVPIIHFGTGTSGLLPLLREAGGDVIGVDWRIELDDAWERLGHDIAIQGNLDPAALLAPWNELQPRVRRVLERAGGRPGHIFNLGHGVFPETPPDNVRRLVDFVHAYSVSAPDDE